MMLIFLSVKTVDHQSDDCHHFASQDFISVLFPSALSEATGQVW
jgi:hypothetical protein